MHVKLKFYANGGAKIEKKLLLLVILYLGRSENMGQHTFYLNCYIKICVYLYILVGLSI